MVGNVKALTRAQTKDLAFLSLLHDFHFRKGHCCLKFEIFIWATKVKGGSQAFVLHPGLAGILFHSQRGKTDTS